MHQPQISEKDLVTSFVTSQVIRLATDLPRGSQHPHPARLCGRYDDALLLLKN